MSSLYQNIKTSYICQAWSQIQSMVRNLLNEDLLPDWHLIIATQFSELTLASKKAFGAIYDTCARTKEGNADQIWRNFTALAKF